ncbi:MAG: 2TM domain-containing protein [bacterium]|nr:2TM domain-containing protein [bacterium]
MTETKARERVRYLKRFYTDLMIYALANLALVLIWGISGGGYFWPIFVIIGWGIGLGLQAFSLGLMPVAAEVFPFLNKGWEEAQVSKILKRSEPKKTEAAVPVKKDEAQKK